MKNYKKYLSICLLALLAMSVVAQDKKHEISASIGGGTAGFSPKMMNENILAPSKKNKAGMNFGIGYAYNFNNSFALVSGVDIDMYKSEFSINEMAGSYLSIDSENDGFLYKYAAKGYNETIEATYLSIPLMARYTHHLTESWGLYFMGGAKLGFVVSSKYNNSLESVKSEGAYVQWGNGANVPTIDDIELEGFGTQNNLSSSGDLDLKVKCSLAAELGAQYKIGQTYSIYLGGYIDYSMNNLRGDRDKDLIQYNGMVENKIHLTSFTEAVYKDKLLKERVVDKLQPLSIGAKIRFSFSL